MKHTGTVWPPIESAYIDEAGEIDPEVYNTAGVLWHQAEKLASRTLRDVPAGLSLMLQAVAIVSRKRTEKGTHIENLAGFLFQTYKRLVLASLEKESGHRRREVERNSDLAVRPVNIAEDIDRKILLQELVQRMDSWTRSVFELLTLGYDYKEISVLFGTKPNILRSKYSKQIKRLIKQIKR